MNFAVSTVAFRGLKIESIMELAKKEKLILEFSSGLPYRYDMESIFLNASIPRLPHNYFPAPQESFVLNLASLSDEILNQSINHCMKGLKLASKVKAPFFSAHAGFCVDPEPSELGRAFKCSTVSDRSLHWNRFINSVKKLVLEAERLGVGFYIENNVCIKSNILSDGSSPLLCTDLNETLRLVQEVKSPALKILIDTGHLKVSANTFDFETKPFVDAIRPYVGAFHHSDNDGRVDSNHPCNSNYWFLPYMSQFKNAYHVLEVCDQSIEQIRFQFDLLEEACH